MPGFAETCSIAVNNTYSTCGTVTRANIATLTPTELMALFAPGGKYAEMDALLKHQFEMKACGVVRSSLYDWIMSSNKTGQGKLVNIHRVARGPSLVTPFILGRQKSVWNHDYWSVTANIAKADYEGQAAPAKPLGTIGATSRALRLTSTFGPLHADYFVPGQYIYVISKGATGSAWNLSHFKVVKSATNSPASFVDLEVIFTQGTADTSASPQIKTIPSDPATNAAATTPWAATGIVLQGINNVDDAEAWCYNRLNVNLEKLVPFWFQTRRKQRCVDSEYKKFFEQMMANNAWYAAFQDLPLTERNRQDERQDQVEFMNAFFFGERISDNQTIDNWKNLDQIFSATGGSVDPGIGAQLMGYRANMIGVLPQLQACQQFEDKGGQDLSVQYISETVIYNIMRSRQSAGRPFNEIDAYTDSKSADQFMTAFINYSNDKNAGLLQICICEGSNSLGMPYRKFKLYHPSGVTLNIITDPYFDDMVLAQPAASYIGKFFMILDMGSGGSIYPAVLASNRKSYSIGDVDQLAKIDGTFSCVMSLPTRERTLTSETTTAIVECPKHSYVIANFANIVK